MARGPRGRSPEPFDEAAAAIVGWGAASEDEITTAVGFSGDAFCTNFDAKDKLVTTMLADHVEQTTRRNSEFLALHTDSHDFLVVLRAVDRSAQDGSGSSPLLLELHLHGTRVSGHGGEVTEFLDPRWRIITHVIEGAGLAETASVRLDPEPLATAPLAARNRFGLHQLMDAKRWPPDSPSIHHFS